MKIVGLCILHYGKEYIGAALQGVYPVCDEIVISYTPQPSHGHSTEAKCPETWDEIYSEIIKNDPTRKVVFKQGIYPNEGNHRSMAMSTCILRDADIVVVFDADEVWDTKSLNDAILKILSTGKKRYGIDGYVNFWKSFNTVVQDQFRPIRLINLRAQNDEEGVVDATIYHFGCAQSEPVMRYKYLIHGHHDELRHNWLEEKYFNWKEGEADLHPVAKNLWYPSFFNKDSLPEYLKRHPNFNKKVI